MQPRMLPFLCLFLASLAGSPTARREGGSEDEEAGPPDAIVQGTSGAPPYGIIFKDPFVCGLM